MSSRLPRYAPRMLAFVTPQDDVGQEEPFVWVALFTIAIEMETTWPTQATTFRMALSRFGTPRIRATTG